MCLVIPRNTGCEAISSAAWFITNDCHMHNLPKSKLLKFEPYQLTSSWCHDSLFYIYAWPRNKGLVAPLLLTFLGDNVRSNMWACGSLFEPELTGCERSVHDTLDGGGLTRKFSDNDCGGHTLQKGTHWKRGTQWWQLETKRKSFQKNLYQWRVGPLRNLSYSAVAVQSGT